MEKRDIAFLILTGLVVGFLITFVTLLLRFFAPFLIDQNRALSIIVRPVPSALVFFETWLSWFILVTGLVLVIYVLWNLKNK